MTAPQRRQLGVLESPNSTAQVGSSGAGGRRRDPVGASVPVPEGAVVGPGEAVGASATSARGRRSPSFTAGPPRRAVPRRRFLGGRCLPAAQHRLDRRDGHLDLAVVGLLGGDRLHRVAGHRQHPAEPRVPVLAGEADDLVGDAGDHRDADDARQDQLGPRGPAEEREGHDGHQRGDHEEARAAARVAAVVLADRGDLQRVAVLERVDGHVLGAVVGEGAPHLRRPSQQQQVAEQQAQAQRPLEGVERDRRVLGGEVRDGRGADAEDHRARRRRR